MGFLAIVALTASMGSDWRRPITWPRPQPGIPERDYKLIEPSATPAPPPVVGTSFNGVEIVDTVKKIKVRTFAMDRLELKALHCSIANASLAIQDNGAWLFSATAQQNPWFTTQPNALPPKKLNGILNVETNYLIRNEFTIKLRCYGNAAVREATKTTGKPLLIEIPLPKVWVQRGVPMVINQQGGHSMLSDYYSLIDRVEFELSVR